MAENEKKLNISISVDGTDTVVGKLGDATDALNAMAEAVGSSGLTGEMKGLNSEMAQTLGVLGSATAATRQAAQASEAAAAATKKETEAQQELNEAKAAGGAGPEGSAPGLDELSSLPPPPREWEEAMKKLTRNAEEATKAIKESAEELEKVADAVEKIGEKSDDSGEKLDKSIGSKRAEMAGQIAGILGQVGGVVRTFSNDLKGLDDKSSKTWGNVADGVDMAAGALSGAAQGFSVGGPFGAAVGGLVGLMSGPLKNAFNNMSSDLQAAKDSLKNAEEWEKKLKNAIRERADEVRNARTNEYYQNELTVLKNQTKELESQRRLRGLEGDVQKSRDKYEDEKAIRAGASPITVEANRTQAKIEAGKKAIDDDLNYRREKVEIANNAVSNGQSKLSQLEKEAGPGAEVTKGAAQELKGLEEAAKRLSEEFEQFKKEVPVLKKGVEVEGMNEFGGQIEDAKKIVIEKVQPLMEAYSQLEKSADSMGNAREHYQKLKDIFEDGINDNLQYDEILKSAQLLNEGIIVNNTSLGKSLDAAKNGNQDAVRNLLGQIDQMKSNGMKFDAATERAHADLARMLQDQEDNGKQGFLITQAFNRVLTGVNANNQQMLGNMGKFESIVLSFSTELKNVVRRLQYVENRS